MHLPSKQQPVPLQTFPAQHASPEFPQATQRPVLVLQTTPGAEQTPAPERKGLGGAPCGVQQASPAAEPHFAHTVPLQRVPGAVQFELAQQASPTPPQVPQTPALHVPSSGAHDAPFAAHFPLMQQPPALQLLPAQQACPVPPHAPIGGLPPSPGGGPGGGAAPSFGVPTERSPTAASCALEPPPPEASIMAEPPLPAFVPVLPAVAVGEPVSGVESPPQAIR
jgi:hypothetical protein